MATSKAGTELQEHLGASRAYSPHPDIRAALPMFVPVMFGGFADLQRQILTHFVMIAEIWGSYNENRT
ncbi:hypothetical protein [Roseovarius albus]|nr:hypothetical protein [Roseovarius albus]